MSVDIVLGMVGGLGLFLYGMKLMSDGLEKAAGAKLRSILGLFTKNRFIAILVGMGFTAIIQSSSATTVLIVSFVNASLMNLFQAAGVILGANIGTTITGQLIALNLTVIAPIFLMCGVIMVMFMKKPFIKKLGESILGFGMLFFGMSTMSSAMSTLKDSPIILEAIASLDRPYMALLVGFIATAILQSSSATVGIVILMASQGILPLEMCFYIILGCNMGSCVSALLASLGGRKMAKRAAWIHFLFNIFGSAIIVIVLAFMKDGIADFITGLTGGGSGTFINNVNAKLAKDVANTHTIFKVFQVLCMLPFTNQIVNLTYRIVPGDDEIVDERHLKYIGEHSLYSPATAIPNAINEIERMGNIAVKNFNLSVESLLARSSQNLEQIDNTELTIDYMNTEITNYLVKVNALSLPLADRKLIGGLFHVVNDIERIGDHAENIAGFTRMELENRIKFSKDGEREIRIMLEKTNELLNYSIRMFTKNDRSYLDKILTLENEIDDLEKEFQNNHVKRLTNNLCTASAGMIFSDVVSNIERVADHGTNIAFSILEKDPEEAKNLDHYLEMEPPALEEKAMMTNIGTE